mmetsp:Transcript_12724/g.30059  ORF Transcript_12724/g.30059 Transcript_12724/m.30059 type:complete len:200 (-) Transcript_12724:551-1150(-)
MSLGISPAPTRRQRPLRQDVRARGRRIATSSDWSELHPDSHGTEVQMAAVLQWHPLRPKSAAVEEGAGLVGAKITNGEDPVDARDAAVRRCHWVLFAPAECGNLSYAAAEDGTCRGHSQRCRLHGPSPRNIGAQPHKLLHLPSKGTTCISGWCTECANHIGLPRRWELQHCSQCVLVQAQARTEVLRDLSRALGCPGPE